MSPVRGVISARREEDNFISCNRFLSGGTIAALKASSFARDEVRREDKYKSEAEVRARSWAVSMDMKGVGVSQQQPSRGIISTKHCTVSLSTDRKSERAEQLNEEVEELPILTKAEIKVKSLFCGGLVEIAPVYSLNDCSLIVFFSRETFFQHSSPLCKTEVKQVTAGTRAEHTCPSLRMNRTFNSVKFQDTDGN